MIVLKYLMSIALAGLLAMFSLTVTASAAPLSGLGIAVQQGAQTGRAATLHEAGYRRKYRRRFRTSRLYYYPTYRIYRPYNVYGYRVYKKKRRVRRGSIVIRLY